MKENTLHVLLKKNNKVVFRLLGYRPLLYIQTHTQLYFIIRGKSDLMAAVISLILLSVLRLDFKYHIWIETSYHNTVVPNIRFSQSGFWQSWLSDKRQLLEDQEYYPRTTMSGDTSDSEKWKNYCRHPVGVLGML